MCCGVQKALLEQWRARQDYWCYSLKGVPFIGKGNEMQYSHDTEVSRGLYFLLIAEGGKCWITTE